LAIAFLTPFGLPRAADTEEHFGGIGVVIAQLYDQDSKDHRGELVVLGVPADSTGAKAGIEAGDIIVAVDGHETKGSAFADLVRRRLRGAVGSPVNLKIRRIGRVELLELQVTRVAMKG